jgi:hypothetical protein
MTAMALQGLIFAPPSGRSTRCSWCWPRPGALLFRCSRGKHMAPELRENCLQEFMRLTSETVELRKSLLPFLGYAAPASATHPFPLPCLVHLRESRCCWLLPSCRALFSKLLLLQLPPLLHAAACLCVTPAACSTALSTCTM